MAKNCQNVDFHRCYKNDQNSNWNLYIFYGRFLGFDITVIYLFLLFFFSFCRSIGKKLSTLLYTNGEDDWSEFLDKTPPAMNQFPEKIPEKTEFKKRTSLPAKLNEPMTQEEVKKEAEEITQLVKFANKKPGGFPIYEVSLLKNRIMGFYFINCYTQILATLNQFRCNS